MLSSLAQLAQEVQHLMSEACYVGETNGCGEDVFEVSKQVETGRGRKIENRLTESLRCFVYVCLCDGFVFCARLNT